MPNYLQLGNCLQFSPLFGHIWDNWGNYRGNLRHFWGNLWHSKENYRQYLDNFEPNCVTIGAIVTLLGQSWIFQGNLGHCWAIVAVLEGFNILICTGIYAFGYKGFNDFVIQGSMLSYIQA